MKREMKTLYVEDDIMQIGDKRIKLSELFTAEFYSYANGISKQYDFGLPIDNVVYYYYILPFLAFTLFLKEEHVSKIEVGKVDPESYWRIKNTELLLQIKTEYKNRECRKGLSELGNRSIIFLSMLYLLVIECMVDYIPTGFTTDEDLIISRSSVHKTKLVALEKGIMLEETSIGRGSFFQAVSRKKRIIGVIHSWRKAKSAYDLMKSKLNERGYSALSVPILRFFAKRLTHIYFWEHTLETILEQNKEVGRIITGAYIDSYSQVEQEVAKRLKRKLIVIPHGLEDRIVYPRGLAGDVFYATTEFARDILNDLYSTKKFIYDADIVNRMYCKTNYIEGVNNQRKFVYFTTGSEDGIDKKIVEHIANYLSTYGIQLYLKFKPGFDTDPFDNIPNTSHIADIVEAMSKNVCISRGSAVLVEAIYNYSCPIQVVLPEDGIMRAGIVPSLSDKRILHCYSLKETDICIKKILRM